MPRTGFFRNNYSGEFTSRLSAMAGRNFSDENAWMKQNRHVVDGVTERGCYRVVANQYSQGSFVGGDQNLRNVFMVENELRTSRVDIISSWDKQVLISLHCGMRGNVDMHTIVPMAAPDAQWR